MSQRKYEQRIADHQGVFVRQSHILRKNMYEWDEMLRSSTGEDWPSMLGRLNAAMNQTNNLDRSIEDVMNHFVYEPKKTTMNPQDIPFFLSVRLLDDTNASELEKMQDGGEADVEMKNPVAFLTKYEKDAADLANHFEETMNRFS
mmetsp:Transcript_15385/g.23009  ORF Transcript_15385/g.23009 Transcript_15385/m.23009 type:complete len:145 (+) Transcript_15385:210-644(+)